MRMVNLEFSSLESMRRSDSNSLNFIDRNLIRSSIVQFSRSGTFVGRFSLGVFDRATILQISGDAGRSKCMATNLA